MSKTVTCSVGNVRGFSHGVSFSGADPLNEGSGFSPADALVQGSTAASNGKDGFSGGNLIVLDSAAHHNHGIGFNNFTGGTGALAMGRSVAQFNKSADVYKVLSLGVNLDSNTPF